MTAYTYDALSRVTAVTDPMGGVTSFTYTPGGEIASVTDPLGNTTTYAYDANGNLASTTDALGNTVSYEYDAMDNQIRECLSVGAAQTHATLWQYDKKGRMIKELNPLSGEKSFSYDANDNITTVKDEEENETVIRYDLNSRPINVHYSDGKEAVFRYNKRGELTELKDWNGTVCMEYGKTGRLMRVTDQNRKTTAYTYDGKGNTTSITYPDASQVTYAYDKNSRMTRVTDAGQQDTVYEYDAVGNTTAVRQPGQTTVYTYNRLDLPAKVTYSMGDGSRQENSYTYDALGNITGVTGTGSSRELGREATYTYDPLGRLAAWREGSRTESYEYDALGNRTQKKVNGVPKAAYVYNAGNQLTQRTENNIPYHYTYDRRGNLTEETCGEAILRKYTYDATNHLVAGSNMESGEKTEYSYNALCMRTKNRQTLVSRPGSYESRAAKPEGGVQKKAFRIRERDYVADYLSPTNRELAVSEKGLGMTHITYGRGYERLSQKLTPETGGTVPGSSTQRSYFQSDLLGSVLFASKANGEVLRYAQRGAWGDLKIPMEENLNSV